jgi:hypothetical protein
MPFVDDTWQERAKQAAALEEKRKREEAELAARNEWASFAKRLDKALQDVGVMVNFKVSDLTYISDYSKQPKIDGSVGMVYRWLEMDEGTAFTLQEIRDGREVTEQFVLLLKCGRCGRWVSPFGGTPATQEELGALLLKHQLPDHSCHHYQRAQQEVSST